MPTIKGEAAKREMIKLWTWMAENPEKDKGNAPNYNKMNVFSANCVFCSVYPCTKCPVTRCSEESSLWHWSLRHDKEAREEILRRVKEWEPVDVKVPFTDGWDKKDICHDGR